MAQHEIYALIALDQDARVLDRAQDGEMAAEAIYMDELQKRLGVYGIIVIDLEMPDNPTGSLADALASLTLGE